MTTTSGEYEQFLNKYPQYSTTLKLDDLRKKEYGRLDLEKQIYLDYTGANLYSEVQLNIHFRMLRENILGNPHSINPTSSKSTQLIDQTRAAILDFFHANPDEYQVVFTLNASGALKLVGESYPFQKESRFLLTFDNHNSVNGIREYARNRGAEITYIPILRSDLRVNDADLKTQLMRGQKDVPNLFAYPAQSNFSSVQHPLEWIVMAHAYNWDVILDASAYVPTNSLDLSKVFPDYVTISFYKMFGYPTGVGALICRRKALSKLQRPWFAGGTVNVASVQGDKYFLTVGPAGFEDGTLNYLSIPAVKIGLDYMNKIGYEMIHTRVHCLTGWLLDQMTSLQYKNGQNLVSIYGPIINERRGGTITFNFLYKNGEVMGHQIVEQKASKINLSLRTGCFCNPGAGETALGISRQQLTLCFNRPEANSHLTYDQFRVCLDGKSSGAVRISLGFISNFQDVLAFLNFTKSFLE